ncbi:hypothetical protein QJS83_03185 [Bdellovibrio sp. 22V]|uniref:hypothetical protein n=1 Tax=Bdellovibrio TaxID=958 RepID=UPI002542905C|nr:hypothetical protein [Bdellovibrio sp. 22V]WII72873.1 hypothetical protein QJS83_03185 [Bdellovibrio sp. 22V]
MKSNRTAALILSLTLAALLTGCEAEQTEKDMLAEAQFCLDKARDKASADACMSKIAGLSGPHASTLRCAAGFIGAEVTDPANLSTALNAIQDGQGAAALLSSLSFPSVSEANATFESCNQSGQAGLALIGAMMKSATVLANAAGSLASCSSPESCDTAQITETITDLIANLTAGGAAQDEAEATVVAIAESIQTVYTTTCGGTSSVNTDICGQIDTAIAQSGVDIVNADPTQLLALGKDLLEEWKNP